MTKSGDQHRSGSGLGYGYPRKHNTKGKQRVCFIYKESVEVPGMGLGESYMRLFGRSVQRDGYWSKETLNTGRGPYLRGPADDVMLHQYGVSDICRSFGDAVCVTAPATAICIRK